MMLRKYIKIANLFFVVLRWVPKLLPKPAKKATVFVKLSAMGDLINIVPVANEAALIQHTTIITTSRSNPKLISLLLDNVELIVISLNPKTWLQAMTAAYGSTCVDFDQYYTVSEGLANFGRFSCSFKTPAKGRSTQTNLVYDPTANELEQFKSLAELALGTQLLINRQLSEIKSKISLPPSILWPNERLLILYPGSSLNAQMRRWPIKNFKELAERYRGSRKIIIAGGPDETNLLNSNFPRHVCNYINQISLANWLSVFAHRDVIFVGNDGGLLHVAGVSGARTIGIFGPALGTKWAPRGQNQIFIQGTCPISPCIRTSEGVIPQTCQLSDHRCLNSVSADVVLGHIERLESIQL